MPAFREITVPVPVYEDVAREYAGIQAEFDRATTVDLQLAAIRRWDELRRRLGTWSNLTDLRFQQDTRNPAYQQALQYRDELRPKLTDLSIRFQRQLVQHPQRAALESRLGRQAFALWEADLQTFDPAIEASLVQESKLEAEYTELIAKAQFEYAGQTYNLSSFAKFREHADRSVREATERLRWAWFDGQHEALDRIYDQQVRLRTEMARTLGFEGFTGLGYRRMHRVDYGAAEVDRFRAAVRDHVVPLGRELRRQQTERLGLSSLRHWDEALFDAQGNPAPRGDHDWMLVRAQEMFDAMGGGLGTFFRVMTDSELLDLKARDGKAAGGFCTDFPSHGVPFIFANFNGTKGDVEVFTHEVGHAFQSYESRWQPLADYLFPTYESCEIHSMSLEYLTWPHMERFFGGDAERFRRIHLTQSLLFLPYGVAVDHFQHLVYAQPNATPDERCRMWQEMERTYLPWRDYADLPHVSRGGFWQSQRHIYLSPFYYIDYTLALTCALQFWTRSRRDPAAALADYVALCRRGGEAPFQELARSAGLISPFEPDCLQDVVAQARKVLAA